MLICWYLGRDLWDAIFYCFIYKFGDTNGYSSFQSPFQLFSEWRCLCHWAYLLHATVLVLPCPCLTVLSDCRTLLQRRCNVELLNLSRVGCSDCYRQPETFSVHRAPSIFDPVDCWFIIALIICCIFTQVFNIVISLSPVFCTSWCLCISVLFHCYSYVYIPW